ncbi:hypothetical protein BC567DRAFT_216238 [Phyllosticta citribraziliensis]
MLYLHTLAITSLHCTFNPCLLTPAIANSLSLSTIIPCTTPDASTSIKLPINSLR